MAERDTTTLDGFLATFTGDREVIEVDVPDLSGAAKSPFVVVRFGEYTMVLNPMGLTDYLDLDIHSFKDGRRTTAAPWGMTNGQRFALEPTGTTSQGWPSASGVFVLVGKQEGA
jgi:hypothetical protein